MKEFLVCFSMNILYVAVNTEKPLHTGDDFIEEKLGNRNKHLGGKNT